MTEDLNSALDILKKGGVILYPTDTVWGLGCDATNPAAVDRIYRIKKREDSKSMLVLLDDEGKLARYVKEVPPIAWEILEAATEPITLIYPGARNLAPNLVAEDGSIGIRITGDEFCRALIRKSGKPLVSSSANISGENAPAIFSEVSQEILSEVDYCVRWRQNDKKRKSPSSIIKIGEGGIFRIIRM